MTKKNPFPRMSVILLLLIAASLASAAERLDLAGRWRFALDRQDRGTVENWFDQSLKDAIDLPGALQSQNYGDEITTGTPWILSLYDRQWFLRAEYRDHLAPGRVKIPFLAPPPRHYVGAAWYQRDVEIPEAWRGRRIVLHLERPHWETTVWLDARKIGVDRSLVAPHEYDLGQIAPGRRRISIRVDNRLVMPYRPDAHSVSDSLGGSWNGIVGRIELRATSPVWIDDAQVYPQVEAKTVVGGAADYTPKTRKAKIAVKIGNATGKAGAGRLFINGRSFPVDWADAGGAAEFDVEFPNAVVWDEFRPQLQNARIELKGEAADDAREVSFGFRDLRAVGKEFRLNGRAVYFRGNHHGGDFALTGYPPTDVAYWRKILQVHKDWGINHVRFHSFCPPEAAFVAADELGVYLQPEPGMWNEVSPGTPMEKMLYEETEKMIRAYGNHPSFLLLSPSNEPKGRWKEAFDKWMAHYRERDPRRLYTNGTGHTEREVPNLAVGADYLAMQRIGPKMLRGSTAWFGLDYGKSLAEIDIPVVSHELGQWVAYPDYDVIKKFTGYLRPTNYEIFRDSLKSKGLLAKNKDFADASGRFQLACYKEEIEANLRTPGLSGFQLLDLHDYLGQGTALVGLLDAFWEEKGYATAAEFRRFNAATVPLARLTKRVFRANERFEVATEIAHFGEQPIADAKPFWKIVDANGRSVASGALAVENAASKDARNNFIPIGKNISLGKISVDLAPLLPDGRARELKLVVGLAGTRIENDWNFWVYPEITPAAEPRHVFVTHSWAEAETRLREGARVLFMPRKADLGWTSPPLDDVPVFWTRLMNPAWSRMLGLWIDQRHPALAQFPTRNHHDWQWTELVRTARAVNLDRLPAALQPIVQPIDDWNRNYKLGLLFEARVGRGRLMFSAADLENDLDRRIVARQLRRSVLEYMAGRSFNPKVSIAPENMRAIFFDTRVMKKLGAQASSTAGEASSAIDGDPNTFWLAGDQRGPRLNHALTIAFPQAVSFSGLLLMPRQNHREHEGDIREYSIQLSDDGANWREIKRGALESTFDPQTISFGQPVTAKFVKIVPLSGFGPDRTTALAELAVLYAGPPLPEDDSDLEYKRSRSATPDIDEGVRPEEAKPSPSPKKP